MDLTLLLYKTLIRPFLFRMDPEEAHERVSTLLANLANSPLASLIEANTRVNHSSLSQNLLGIDFPNPVGGAAGLDKTGRVVLGWQMLGMGFVSLGTWTPDRWSGLPKPRIHRFPGDESTINRMQFPNPGCDRGSHDLSLIRERIRIPTGVSISKNVETKVSDLDAVGRDYLNSIRVIYPHVDYVEMNISSPNTEGLTLLQGKAAAQTLLDEVQPVMRSLAYQYERGGKPVALFWKLSPDMSPSELDAFLEVCAGRGVGIIAANTTQTREGLSDPRGQALQGGMSGPMRYGPTCEMVQTIRRRLGDKQVIMACGGINTADRGADAMIYHGADLVQIYNGLVYEGPGLIKSINRELVRRVKVGRVDLIRELFEPVPALA